MIKKYLLYVCEYNSIAVNVINLLRVIYKEGDFPYVKDVMKFIVIVVVIRKMEVTNSFDGTSLAHRLWLWAQG